MDFLHSRIRLLLLVCHLPSQVVRMKTYLDFFSLKVVWLLLPRRGGLSSAIAFLMASSLPRLMPFKTYRGIFIWLWNARLVKWTLLHKLLNLSMSHIYEQSHISAHHIQTFEMKLWRDFAIPPRFGKRALHFVWCPACDCILARNVHFAPEGFPAPFRSFQAALKPFLDLTLC